MVLGDFNAKLHEHPLEAVLWQWGGGILALALLPLQPRRGVLLVLLRFCTGTDPVIVWPALNPSSRRARRKAPGPRVSEHIARVGSLAQQEVSL